MAGTQVLLDPIPIAGVFIGFVLISVAAFEIGYRFGLRQKARRPDDPEGATGMLVGSVLALLAFLMAVTMSFAADRFDTRRGFVMDEATTINTAYLRAGYLPEPYSSDVRDLLREYVPLRIATDQTNLAANVALSEEIHDELWAQTELVATKVAATDITALFIDSVNEIIELHSRRIQAGVFARVPDTVLVFLIALALVSVGMVGYGAGLTGRRSIVSAVLLIVVLGATLTLIVDLDRPREGFIQVSQRPLIVLQEKLSEPAP
jgi:hypothetical protein